MGSEGVDALESEWGGGLDGVADGVGDEFPRERDFVGLLRFGREEALELNGDDVVDGSEVGAGGEEFVGGFGEELDVVLLIGGEVEAMYGGVGLTDAVDAAVALFESCGVPGDVEVK